MKAADIMTTDVVTVGLAATVGEIAELLLARRISAVPVVDAAGKVLGIVSEGDLIRRAEIGTESHPSWWLRLISSETEVLKAFVKSRGRRAEHVMTPDPVVISGDTELGEIATILEKKRIKRVPVVENGKLVGIVSRANLLHALATAGSPPPAPVAREDKDIRKAVAKALTETGGVSAAMINVVVSGGVVELWGGVDNDAEARAAIVAAETVPGVVRVEDHLGRMPAWAYGY